MALEIGAAVLWYRISTMYVRWHDNEWMRVVA